MSNEHEHSQPNFDALSVVETSLQSFTPIALHVDRDRLMFLAGRATAEAANSGGKAVLSTPYSVFSTAHAGQNGPPRVAGRHWPWPAATATLAATSLVLLTALLLRPAPQPQIVYREHEVSAAAPSRESQPTTQLASTNDVPLTFVGHLKTAEVPANNYLRSREVALRMGVDAIGSPPTGGNPLSAAATYGDWLLELSSGPQSENSPPRTLSSPNL